MNPQYDFPHPETPILYQQRHWAGGFGEEWVLTLTVCNIIHCANESLHLGAEYRYLLYQLLCPLCYRLSPGRGRGGKEFAMPSEEEVNFAFWSSGLHDAMRCGDKPSSEYYYCIWDGDVGSAEMVCGTSVVVNEIGRSSGRGW